MIKGSQMCPEQKIKISASLIGHPVSSETREKIRAANVGRKHTPEELEKMKRGTGNTGKIASPEKRLKMSLAHKGKKQPHIGVPRSTETRLKMSKSRMGRLVSPETRAKISKSQCGEKANNWHGGLSFEPYCPKWNNDLRRRIRAFFEYRCVACGKPQNENLTADGRVYQLHCHHVTYNKSTCCDDKPVHFTALCNRHHGMTNKDRDRWEAMLHRIIDEVYGGRSYYTKEEMQ